MGSWVLLLAHVTILQQWIQLLKKLCQRRKKRLSWLINNRASDCWRTVPATVEDSCKRIQKHKMDVWFNVNIPSTLDLQITYYVQKQFHKVLPLVLTNAGRGFPEALLTQPLHPQLFNMLQMLLQETKFWLWPFNLGRTFCLCLEARNFKIFST